MQVRRMQNSHALALTRASPNTAPPGSCIWLSRLCALRGVRDVARSSRRHLTACCSTGPPDTCKPVQTERRRERPPGPGGSPLGAITMQGPRSGFIIDKPCSAPASASRAPGAPGAPSAAASAFALPALPCAPEQGRASRGAPSLRALCVGALAPFLPSLADQRVLAVAVPCSYHEALVAVARCDTR